MASLLRTPGFQNCLGGAENPRCGLIGNFLLTLQPMLNVAACRSRQSDRFAADERDGFSFHFPVVPFDAL